MSEVDKIAVYNAWKDGQSKASLALQYDTSSRSIGRWIDAVEESGYVKPEPVKVVDKTDTKIDLRYLQAFSLYMDDYCVSKGDLAKKYGVSVRTIGRWLERAEKEQKAEGIELDSFDWGPPVGQGKSYQETDNDCYYEREYKYVASSRSITITEITDGVISGSASIDKDTTGFEAILDDLILAQFSREALVDAFISLQPTLSLEKFSQGKLQIDPKERRIFYVADEDTVPYEVNNSLSNRVIDLLRNGDKGVQTMINFMEKLMENPSRRAVNELYGFLEASDIEIAEDGDFYAWKYVTSDFKDSRTRTFDNSPGSSPRVARNMVDEDSETTCSYGLHVCAKSYFSSFSDAKIVKVKVNPADVVAIPKDYNNAKMRCAGYYVVEDVTDSNVWR